MNDDPATSPYAPPREVSGEPEIKCPNCGKRMDHGELASSTTIRWRSNSASTWEVFLSGGRKIGDTKSGWGYRLAALFCEQCHLIWVQR